MASFEYDVVGVYICLSTVIALCYEQNTFWYSGDDAVYLTTWCFHFLFRKKPNHAWPLFAL